MRAVVAGVVLAVLATACSAGDTSTLPSPTSQVGTSPSEVSGASPGAPTPASSAPERAIATATPTGPSARPRQVVLAEVASGLAAPVQVLPGPGGDLLVVEQVGRIQRLHAGETTTYLDLTDRVTTGGERGLLGAALDPAAPDRLFVHYSGPAGRTTLSRFEVTADAGDPDSEVVLLTHDQPAPNHNGGGLVFGPDAMLYLGLGDGGAAGDRFGNGQRPDTLLGTILRLDVSGEGYEIPPDNPWPDGDGGAREVWAYGLRNPWRFAFGDGRLYIADVGQGAVEEVDAEPATAPGRNYGWPILEGDTCYRSPTCDRDGLVLPATTYTHAETGGCSVIGGEVYTGRALPDLAGWFVYTDLCAGFLRAVRVDDGGVAEADITPVDGPVTGILGFGHGPDGELYACVQDGRILRLLPPA